MSNRCHLFSEGLKVHNICSQNVIHFTTQGVSSESATIYRTLLYVASCRILSRLPRFGCIMPYPLSDTYPIRIRVFKTKNE
jgi:hypothetical protein